MKVGYARVSTKDQDFALQRDALKNAGCKRIFSEKISGAKRERPQLQAAMNGLHPGDVLVVWKLDRLARSLRHLIEILEELDRREIGFLSITDSIDTTTAAGKLVFHIVGAMAEFERSLISQRTKAAMQCAKDQGLRLGRRPKLNEQQREHIRRMSKDDGLSLETIAALMSVSRSTVWRAIG
ncbi:recombinase family protein [Undibacterium sp. Di26W]|uniref:recombinase family protein n=1 Tax=Undibacterium sp. Di26W TaxID=3413035 RepID=UPI003BF01354